MFFGKDVLLNLYVNDFLAWYAIKFPFVLKYLCNFILVLSLLLVFSRLAQDTNQATRPFYASRRCFQRLMKITLPNYWECTKTITLYRFNRHSLSIRKHMLNLLRIFETFKNCCCCLLFTSHSLFAHLHRYHNKENSVISALLAEVHAKASVVTSQVDEGLFYKLRSYFPTTDSDTIRQLLAK